ncbi:MAG TPA: amidohydrolase [Gammaproteobacteria bacterium]
MTIDPILRRIAILALLSAAFAARAAAQSAITDDAVAALVEERSPKIVEIRHRIHANPELGNREHETARLVAQHLRDLGLEVRTGVAHTGVVALLRGGRPGPTVAVRADMDALPVVEETDLPFKSTVRTTYLGQEVGVMHACGHDVHTAVQLGVASVLAALRDELPGTVKFIFQPAEEGPPPGEEGGARLMVAEGVLRDPEPEAIFGLHSEPRFEVGEVGFAPGPAWAAVDHFRATIRGRQSHGAAPQDGIDPIVMAAQAVTALQTIRSRNLPPLAPSVITVGIIRGGTRYNIIPGEVHLEGTVRTYDPAVQDTVERRMHEILDGITRAGGGGYELEYDRITPVVINDRALAERMLPTLRRVLGAERVHDIEPQMAGEDFAYFANEVPGFFYRLGTRTPGGESGGLHTPTFLADDGAVAVGMRLMTSVVLDYLRARSGED